MRLGADPSPRVRLVWWLAALGGLVFPRAAFAGDDDPVAVAIDYDATQGCPTSSEFFAEVRARASRVREATPSDRPYRVRVRIAGADARTTGVLELVDLDGHRSVRRLGGDACPEIARALALVVALDVAGVANAPAAPAPPPSPPASPVPPPPPAPAPPPPTELHTAAAQWSPAVALLAGGRTGISTSIAPVGVFAFEVERGRARWAPSMRVSAAYAAGTTPGSGDTVVFRLTTVSLEGCVGRVQLFDGHLELVPCARLEAGVHLGEVQPNGRGLAGAPWVAPGLTGRARVPLAFDIFAELDVWGQAPLRRTRFLEGTDTSTVFLTPSLAAGFALGLGMSFP